MHEQVQAPISGATAELCLDRRFRKPRLNPIEASAYLSEVYGVSTAVSTLAKWRCLKSDGPKFQRYSRSIFYRRDDLDEWVRARLGEPVNSTSED